MLARMESVPIDLETMRRLAGLARLELSDADLEAMRPAVHAWARLMAAVESLPLAEVEPAVQYRML